MPDLTPCPRDDCKATVDHWHAPHGTARCCYGLLGGRCDHYACYAPHDQHSTTDAANLLATVQDAIARDWAPCPLCQGHVRQTVGLVCQLCGHDYRPDPDAALVETMAKAILAGANQLLAQAWDDGRDLGLRQADYEYGVSVRMPDLSNPYRQATA